jgi:hypothetical protein
MISDSTQLGEYLRNESSRLKLHLGHDTHYDAMNWELSWWQASVLHRLDFQPLEDDTVAITHHRAKFRYLPRMRYWLDCNIPELFSWLPQPNTEWNCLSTVQFPLKEEDVSSYIAGAITA